MAESDDLSRRYEAPCPTCGAPVRFSSAQATHAVCAYCRSTVVRDGEVLRRLGRVGELFDDHSPLKLGMSGALKQASGKTQAFTLIGRLQYAGEAGRWTEWVGQGPQGEHLILAEDNGRYVLSQQLPAQAVRALPDARSLKLDQVLQLGQHSYTVTSLVNAHLHAAEGEFFSAPPDQGERLVVELRNAKGQVLSWEAPLSQSKPSDAQPPASPVPPEVYLGQSVALADLGIQGLGGSSTRKEQGQQFSCVACGAAVTVTLDSTKSITCPSCNSLMDLSQGVGKDLRAAVQDEPIQPLIALGSVGKFDGTSWQVVGFIHKMGRDSSEASDDDDHDEEFGWEEYVLYHRERGFAFLVDTVEGWNWAVTATGAPDRSRSQQTATYQGQTYRLQERYKASTEYVAGEFYWPVVRGQESAHADYRKDQAILSMERTGVETVWSHGKTLTATEVAQAFGRLGELSKFRRDGGEPVGDNFNGSGCASRIVWVVAALFLLPFLLMMCSSDEPRCRPNPAYDPNNLTDPQAAQREICESSSSRSGSYGGYSSGGYHK